MPYEMWMNVEMPVGGVMDLPGPDVLPRWVSYVSTPDLAATLAKIGDVHATAPEEEE